MKTISNHCSNLQTLILNSNDQIVFVWIETIFIQLPSLKYFKLINCLPEKELKLKPSLPKIGLAIPTSRMLYSIVYGWWVSGSSQ